MRDPKPHHSHRHLYHLVGVRVIHEGTRTSRHKFIDERLAGRNTRLSQTDDAIHPRRQALPMPMHRSDLWQLVGHEDAHAVPLDDLDGRTRTLTVVAPKVGFEPRRELAQHGFGDQMEFFDSAIHSPR